MLSMSFTFHSHGIQETPCSANRMHMESGACLLHLQLVAHRTQCPKILTCDWADRSRTHILRADCGLSDCRSFAYRESSMFESLNDPDKIPSWRGAGQVLSCLFAFMVHDADQVMDSATCLMIALCCCIDSI